jgi:broad specificity phosphatase PhoE
MSITRVGLLRHGQTDWNIDFRLQGTSDIPMNATGLAQAKAAAGALEKAWDAVISSPLDRALKTAEFAAERLEIATIGIEPLLLERSFGEAEGMSYDEWKKHYPDSHVPGGESIAQLEQRCQRLLTKLASDFYGTSVLAVSHGALIRKLINIASEGQLPREGERLGNASLSVLIHEGSGWKIEHYGPQTLS